MDSVPSNSYGNLDEQIAQLMQCKPLSEQENMAMLCGTPAYTLLHVKCIQVKCGGSSLRLIFPTIMLLHINLKGFTPKFQKEWDLVDWSHGCVRKTSLNCTGDVFQKYSGLKLPSTEQSWLNRSMNLKECEMVCMKNCSCTAYTNLDIRDGGRGCLLWYGDLIDIRYSAENAQDIYIRMASSELGM